MSETVEIPAAPMLTYKIQLRPTRRQYRALDVISEQQRHLYNAALEERISAYEKGYLPSQVPGKVESFEKSLRKKAEKARDKALEALETAEIPADNTLYHVEGARSAILSAYEAAIAAIQAKVAEYANTRMRTINDQDQSRSLTEIRANDPAFEIVQRRIQRATLTRLQRAYDAFFRRVKEGTEAPGFPRFKGRDFWDGFAFDAFMQVTFDGRRIRFAGMPGGLRVMKDRPLPGVIKGIHFKREGRRWYVGFQCEYKPKPERKKGKAIGVDWGTSSLLVLSSGEEVANPRPGEALASELRRLARAVSRKKKGSKSRLKARRHKQAIERKIRNRRRNTLNKVSKRLVKDFRFVAVEELNARGMVSKETELPRHIQRRRNRELLDAAPGLLRQMIAYKAMREGAVYRAVDAKHTTQECSGGPDMAKTCGYMVEKPLTEMWHRCAKCGCSMPRKRNAALVVLKRALGITVGPDRGSAKGQPKAKRGTGPAGSGNTGEGRKARTSGRRGVTPPSPLSSDGFHKGVDPG